MCFMFRCEANHIITTYKKVGAVASATCGEYFMSMTKLVKSRQICNAVPGELLRMS